MSVLGPGPLNGTTPSWPRRIGNVVTLIALFIAPIIIAIGVVNLGNELDDNRSADARRAESAFIDQCETDNDTREAIRNYLAKQRDRAEDTYRATLASPFATELQKVLSQRALDSLNSQGREAATDFAGQPCIYGKENP